MKSKLKDIGQKAFVKMGNVAVEYNATLVPFSQPGLCVYEKPMTKRKNRKVLENGYLH